MNINSDTNISKGELVATLSDIDGKINNLHVRSTSDFMQLNDHLKDYHAKTKLISENAFRIFETISGGKDMDLSTELKSILSKLEAYRASINKENLKKIKILKDICLASSQLNITLKNLRQDFTTLKFLSANYMLISNYNDSPSASTLNQEKWDSEISSIHKTIISLNELIDIFWDQINSTIDELTTEKDKVFELFNELSTETNRNIDSVTLKSNESKLHFPVLKEKTIETSRKISDIITHLQYHDIIRQKIEHIQKSHYRIIDDLKLAGENSNDDCSHDDYIKVGDIIDLQAAQLLLVSKEYQNALNVITRNFQGIAKDMKTVSEISDRFSFDSNESENTLIAQIRKQLDNGIVKLDQNNNGLTDTGFLKPINELSEILVRLETGIISNLAGFIGNNGITNWFKFNEAASGVYSQMVVLNRDIDIKCQSIGDNISELRNMSEEIANMGSPDVETNQFEIERLQLMVRITRILDMLDRGNEELDMVLKQNREMNNNILQKLENVISKNDYCKYFETIVGEIIFKLSGINTRIRPSSPGNKKSENLKDMIGSYTMESERIIHNMVVKGDDEDETNGTADESSDDVEFF